MKSNEPCSLLLLDEPTSQIDSQSQKQVLKSIFDQARIRRTTVLMIAHKLESAVMYSDRVLVMDQGTVKEFDTAEKLLDLNNG